ncbi:MAG: hypothetical protein IKX04_07895 [Clostridiales bacterium]|nr:hypothetical protein [Clostridiales bacterium]MBR5058473.1 hypothetical protein [Clostridiales bacterium]
MFTTARERVEEMPEKAIRNQQKPKKAKLTHKYSTPLLVALCIILAVVTIVLVYMIRNHMEAKDGAKEQLRLSAIAGFDCEYSEAQQLYPFQSGLLKVSNKRVAYLSISGNEIYSVDLETASPICIQNGPYAMVADTEGFLCALFSEEGMVYKTHMTGKIGNVALAPSGLSAVIIDDADSFGSVYIMEKDSTFLAKWSSYESGYPLSLAFSPDESTLSVSLVDTDGSQMIPHMKQFSIPKDRTTARPSEYAYYTPISSDIMPILAYLSNDKVAIAGISDVAIAGNGECNAVTPGFPCVSSMMSFDGGYAVVYSDGIDQPFRLASYNSNGSKIGEVDLGNDVLNFDVSGSMALFAVDEKILLIDLSSARVTSSLGIDEPVLRISFFGTKNVCVVTSAGVREITI